MAVTFPPNPNVGDTVTDPTTGAVWQWNGVAWVAQGMGAGGFLPLAGGTMTGPLAMNGAAATVTLAGNAAQPLQAVPLQQVEGFTGNNIGRNYIHNPMFNINQRGATSYAVPAPPSFIYGLDRWVAYTWASGDSATMNQNAFTDAGRAVIGDENAEYNMSVAFTGGSGASNEIYFTQRIEDLRRLSGKTCTVSFWASASAALRFGLSYNQYFGAGGSPSPNVVGNIGVATLTTNWVKYSYTFTIPSSAGKTFGTTANSSTALVFWLSCPPSSPDYATSGNVGTQSGTIAIWGVQLEVGSIATPFEHRDPEIELALCQRFFQTFYLLSDGYTTGGSTVYTSMTVLVPCRASPTITPVGVVYSNASGLQIISQNNAIQGQVSIIAQGYGYATFNAQISADL